MMHLYFPHARKVVVFLEAHGNNWIKKAQKSNRG